ncbi:hypothetical protein Cpir12675_004096 [Ceratocystis pirilliformis]|uniref:Uncharacterized protein n=1 Tax=Ceratocystis pirilliformis TaxID=259994 RepID=A0ABR3Z0B8_9PEZI
MPAVQSQVTGPGTFLIARNVAKASLGWLIGAVLGGSVLLAGALSIVLYTLSIRRKRALTVAAMANADSSAVPPNLVPLDSATTLKTSIGAPESVSEKRGLRAFFRFRQKPYVGSLTRKTSKTKLKKTRSVRHIASLENSLGSPRRNDNWINDDALHGPTVMQHLAFTHKSQSLNNAWVVGSPTLPDIAGNDAPVAELTAVEKEREQFYLRASNKAPYPMFSGNRSASTNTARSEFILHGYGLHQGSLPVRYSSASTATGVSVLCGNGVVTPRTPPKAATNKACRVSVSSSSDRELQGILHSTDQRLLCPANASSALSSIMRTPTSAKNRSLRGSPSRTPVYGITPQSSCSPEKAKLASTLNVSKWHILTAENMETDPSMMEYDSDSEDGEHLLGDEDEDLHGSILTQEFSTVLSPAGGFVSPIHQSIEEDDVADLTSAIDLTAELESAQAEFQSQNEESRSPSICSTVSSALSTLYSADEREDAPSPPPSASAFSDISTKLGLDATTDADDTSSGDDPFSPIILNNFPKTKHLSVNPLSILPKASSTRKVYSCPPPPRCGNLAALSNSPLTHKSIPDTASPRSVASPKVTATGSPIRQRQPAVRLSIPPLASPPSKVASPKSDELDQIPMKRIRPSTPGNVRRSSSTKIPSSASMAGKSLTRKSSLSDHHVRAVMLQNNDNARMITPIKGHQIRIITPSASLRVRAMAAKQRQRAAKDKDQHLRPMRSSPTLGSHDHGNASVSSPGTSGSSSPETSAIAFATPQLSTAHAKASVPTVVISTLRSVSTNSLLSSNSGTSLLSLGDSQLTPSASFQMAMSRGAGPSGVYIPQSLSSSSFDLTPATALDVTINELRRRNSQTPNHRAQSYAGPSTVMTVGMGIMDSPTLPHYLDPITMQQFKRPAAGKPPVAMTNYRNRRRTHTGMTSSGSVSRFSGPSRILTGGGRGRGIPAPKRRQIQVMSKASREDMSAGTVQSPLLPLTQNKLLMQAKVARKSSLRSATSSDEINLPALTTSTSTWTDENLLTTPSSKPTRKPSVTFAQTDDVVLLSDDSNFHNLTIYDDGGLPMYPSHDPSKLSGDSIPGPLADQ